jgi:hypothetical protein
MEMRQTWVEVEFLSNIIYANQYPPTKIAKTLMKTKKLTPSFPPVDYLARFVTKV